MQSKSNMNPSPTAYFQSKTYKDLIIESINNWANRLNIKLQLLTDLTQADNFVYLLPNGTNVPSTFKHIADNFVITTATVNSVEPSEIETELKNAADLAGLRMFVEIVVANSKLNGTPHSDNCVYLDVCDVGHISDNKLYEVDTTQDKITVNFYSHSLPSNKKDCIVYNKVPVPLDKLIVALVPINNTFTDLHISLASYGRIVSTVYSNVKIRTDNIREHNGN